MEIYVVRRGDTLYALARRFSVPTEDIVYANQLQNPDLLMVGQALLIPRAQTRYTVRWGDTLNAIALRYGLSLRRLLDANPQITNPDRIIAGQALFLPPSSPYQGDMLVNGYVTDVSEDTLRATLPYLSFLSPFSYRIDMAGNLIRSFRVMPELSAVQQVANLLTLTNLREQGGFSSDVAHAVFTDGDIQSRLLSQLEQILEAGGYRGVNLDFEYVYPFDRDSYNQFLQRLTDRLHGLGYLVVSALAPKLSDSQQGLLYAAHDYAFHGKTVDYVVLMTYEWGYTYGPAMAVSPLHMVKRVLDYAVSVMPAGKILMGVPNYGYDWTLPFVQGSAARVLSNVQAISLAARQRVAIQYDLQAQSPFFRYQDDSGRQHEVWFEDARSLQAKYRLVKEYGLAGVSFWNLNTLFRTSFLVLESEYSVEKL